MAASNPNAYIYLRTVAQYLSFLAIGLAITLFGPTVVSMEILLDTDTKSLSAAMSGHAIGLLGGAIVCGFIYAPLNKELIFILALFVLGTSAGVAPYAWNLHAFIAAFVLQGFSLAITITGGESYIIKLWDGHKYRNYIVHGSHLVFSLGSTLGPFIMRPFLADIRPSFDNSTNATSTPLVTDSYNASSSSLVEDVASVRMAYLTVALLIISCTSCYIVAFFLMRPSCCERKEQTTRKNTERVQTERNRAFKITLLFFVSLFLVTYMWVEGNCSAFIAVFVVKELGWHNKHGALITSVYWAAVIAGRLIGTLISARISVRSLLLIDLIISLCGCSLMLLAKLHGVVMWIGISVAGLGMGTVYASVYLWVQQYIEVTGAVSSILSSAVAVGAISYPLVTGYMFDEVSHMSLIYVIFSASVLQFIIFLCTCVYAHIHTSRKRQANNAASRLEDVNGTDVENIPLDDRMSNKCDMNI